MLLRVALSVLLGACTTLCFNRIPSVFSCLISLLLIAFLCIQYRHFTLKIALAYSIGLTLAVIQIESHQSHALPLSLENTPLCLQGVLSEIQLHPFRVLFCADQVLDPDLPWKMPACVWLWWRSPPSDLSLGEKWALSVKLKRTRSYSNPGGFDLEKQAFWQGYHATGTVLDFPSPLRLSASNVAIHQWVRHQIERWIAETLSGRELVGLIQGLVVGVKDQISSEAWEILQATGTSHLMAISGLHLGFVTGFCFWLLRKIGGFLPAQCLWKIPAPMWASWGALLAASLYALLAGFSLPTERAWIMCFCALMGSLTRQKISFRNRWSMALLLLLVLQPLSILSAGFWLSFAAVGALAFLSVSRLRNQQFLWRSVVLQGGLFLGLLPLTGLFFGMGSWISPLANFIAIPWVSFGVLIPALFGSALSWIPLGEALLRFSLVSMECLWTLLKYLAKGSYSSGALPVTLPLCITATLGSLWIFLPRGFPGKIMGVLGVLPIFCPLKLLVPLGALRMTLLDVGQGLSVVLQTKSHTLIYDTGQASANRANLGLVPYLRSQGVHRVDRLILSHADHDHIGGAPFLLKHMSIQELWTSDSKALPSEITHPSRLFRDRECRAGQSWQWDGVQFQFLHPTQLDKKRNEHSCVLRVEARGQVVLLTGDIGVQTERRLIQSHADQLRAAVLIVPHHGSGGSSHWEFIQAVGPQYALVSAGHLNQYRHPRPAIRARYLAYGSEVLETEYQGAMTLMLGEKHEINSPDCYRIKNQKFWNLQNG